MAKKTILLIADDPRTVNAVKDILKREYQLETVKDAASAAVFLSQKPPELIIIDFELNVRDGLLVFKELGTSVKVIMLSASDSIPLAVSATKQGVAEFLRKPINSEQLRKAVDKNIAQEEIRLRWIEGMAWLSGGSPAVEKMMAEIGTAIGQDKHIILLAEPGIKIDKIAQFIHHNGPRHKRKMVRLDLSAFRQEAQETQFWATMQELLAAPAADSLLDEADRCGTILFSGIDDLDEHFRLSIFNFFVERRGKSDKSIRVIINSAGDVKAAGKEYARVRIPPLVERKEDLPYLLKFYLKHYSDKHGKRVKYIAAELLEFLAAYDYPGNYRELEGLIENAVLMATNEILGFANLPFDQQALLTAALINSSQKDLSLAEARRGFEKDLYHVLLKKTDGKSDQVAEFLDIPRTVLAARLENLLD
ncbi:MAG: response regulator [Candidatus Margulisbacteria bacterium]|nr:response regulator [Candidatus Margulisiibacteriota bacterium]